MKVEKMLFCYSAAASREEQLLQLSLYWHRKKHDTSGNTRERVACDKPIWRHKTNTKEDDGVKRAFLSHISLSRFCFCFFLCFFLCFLSLSSTHHGEPLPSANGLEE